MQYVDRKGWGARPPAGPRNALDPKPLGVGVHWNGPGCAAQIKTHDRCAGFLRGIQAFHMGPSRGWSDVAYSVFVCPHGYVFEGRGRGVGTAAFGTNHGNRYFYAIYAMWGQGDGPAPEAMLDGITDAVGLCRTWGAGTQVIGHRDENKGTECPGDELHRLAHAGRFNPSAPRPNTKPNPAPPAPEKDWFDMASENDLRQIIREELATLPAKVWAERVSLTDDDRKALGGSKLTSISAAGMLKTGVRLQARQTTADAVLKEVRE